MCAICGIVNLNRAEPVDETVLRNMAQAMVHRGPDDDGFLIDGHAGLGFRRLSIIDLSGGHQPIFNEDDSLAIVFNGEIYNYRDLARELASAGHTFKTKSDTETILHAYEQYGDDCVDHLRGMFAFAIWDRNHQRLLLARDRLGVKPLYYFHDGRTLAFASEIKALLEIPGIPREVDSDAFDQYLALRYVPGPRTMFKNIFRLQPGHTLVAERGSIRIRKYWDVDYSSTAVASSQDLEQLLEESVRLRLISEVPLGVFLSGGLDSSTILASMNRAAGQTVKSFSIGYEAVGPDERDACELGYARIAARALGSDHHEFRMNAAAFQRFIPDLVWHLDEPLADASCIPLHFISKLASKHITVVLSGEGADEILGGYGIYQKMLAIDRVRRYAPPLANLARITPNAKLRRYLRMSGQSLEQRYRGVCRGFDSESRAKLTSAARTTRSDRQLAGIFGDHFSAVGKATPLNRMLYVDTKVWLPDDLLLKADKMTMANGLELRVPFLDHKLVEFAASLPDRSKLHGRTGKSILRTVARNILPQEILNRPKKGFSIPLASWLRGPLRQFTRDHLLDSSSALNSYVNRSEVSRIVTDHEQGRADRSQELWALLVFEFWHSSFIRNSAHRRRAA
jgi:asparagine synthase (glutamine-hydrolysing)